MRLREEFILYVRVYCLCSSHHVWQPSCRSPWCHHTAEWSWGCWLSAWSGNAHKTAAPRRKRCWGWWPLNLCERTTGIILVHRTAYEYFSYYTQKHAAQKGQRNIWVLKMPHYFALLTVTDKRLTWTVPLQCTQIASGQSLWTPETENIFMSELNSTRRRWAHAKKNFF